MKNKNLAIFIMAAVVFSSPAFAQTNVSADSDGQDSSQQVFDACLANASVIARPEQTIGQLQTECLERSEGKLISDRNILEKRVASNPFAILPHRQNYILPFTET